MIRERVVLAMMAGLFCLAQGACAQEEKKPRIVSDPHPGPESMTMADKVRQASFAFLGTAVDMVFIQENHRERTARMVEPPAMSGGSYPALLAVSVNRVLYSDSPLAQTIWLSYASAPGDLLAEQKERLLGKQMIFFGQEAGPHAYQLIGTGRQPLSFRRYILTRARALRGPVANPLPLSELPAVEDAIREVRKTP